MKRILTIAAGVLLAGSAMAQVNEFQVAVDRFAHADYLRNASVGVCVMDVDSGTVLASNAPDLAITTASTMKTVTSASALALLGKDYCFHTTVSAIGELKGNRLRGNVVVKGFGDPTLGSRHFASHPNIVAEVVAALDSLGVKKIDGSIVYDESAYPFETFSDNWMIEDLAYD